MNNTSLFANLNKLESLIVNSNQLKSVKELKNLTKLSTLDLNSNRINSLQGLENLKRLNTLDLHSNTIEYIQDIENLTALTSLNLYSNQIKSIRALENLDQLKTLLFLFSNQIESLEGSPNLNKIEYLDLQNNNISFIGGFYFTKSISLKSIFLMNNVLKSIQNLTFSHLNKLIVINLDYNIIETIQMHSFYNLPQIQYIYIRYNRIKTISDFSFVSKTMFSLILYGNEDIEHISPNSFSNMSLVHFSYESLLELKTFDYNYFKMDVLDLKNCRIKTLRENIVKGYFSKLILSLNILSAFENDSFGYLPNLKEISFSKNVIKKLNFQNAFQFKLLGLEKLDFQFNKIDFISSFDFFLKFPNLTSLDVSFNSLFSLTRSSFQNLLNLKRLHLGSNQILTIHFEAFAGLTNLLRLDLSNNLLYDLSESIFVNLNKLNELILSENKLEILDRECFRGLNSLTILDLGQNQLMILQSDTFFYLANIKTLILASNQLKQLNDSIDRLNKIEFLNISCNHLKHFNGSLHKELTFLDLSHNTKLKEFENLVSLKMLNLSNTDSGLVLSLNFSIESRLEELDLSLNNLTYMTTDYFSQLPLKVLTLRDAQLKNFDFIKNLKSKLIQLDLSNNQNFGLVAKLYDTVLLEINKLIISNVGLKVIPFTPKRFTIKTLDLSNNYLKSFDFSFGEDLTFTITHLDVKHNTFELISSVMYKDFMIWYVNLVFLDFSNSFSSKISDTIFYFNKRLEIALFSGNFLKTFPKFCQFCFSTSCNKFSAFNTECKLRELRFDSNRLEEVTFFDLKELTNLEYLNLENNLISSIEANSFLNLVKLATLILSFNRLSLFADISLFSSLSNLQLLNISSNQLEIIPSYMFDHMFKLETLDLSLNKIHFICSFSFNDLTNLRNMHLNDNAPNIQIQSNETFTRCDSIQNIYVSHWFFHPHDNVNGVLNIFEENKKQTNKSVLERRYYKSLFLITNYSAYDCNLTLFFIQQNVHLNFKTETDIYDYFNECSHIVIKNASSDSKRSNRNSLVLGDIRAYFFWAYLAFLLSIGFYLLAVSEVKHKKKLNIITLESDDKSSSIAETKTMVENSENH